MVGVCNIRQTVIPNSHSSPFDWWHPRREVMQNIVAGRADHAVQRAVKHIGRSILKQLLCEPANLLPVLVKLSVQLAVDDELTGSMKEWSIFKEHAVTCVSTIRPSDHPPSLSLSIKLETWRRRVMHR